MKIDGSHYWTEIVFIQHSDYVVRNTVDTFFHKLGPYNMSQDDLFKSKVNTIFPSVLSNMLLYYITAWSQVHVETVVSELISTPAHSASRLAVCLLCIVETVLSAVFLNDSIHQYKLSVI